MLVYDNNNINLMAVSRCGHTSLYVYLGIEVYSLDDVGFDYWQKNINNCQRIVVLRNPYHRVFSAAKMMTTIHSKRQYAEGAVTNPQLWFANHSMPYMWQIVDYDFKYINFERLNEYVGKEKSNLSIVTNSISYSQQYIANKYYTEYNLQIEFQNYNKILDSKQEISPEEWKELIT
jgi:hypothetical protein